jgi:Ni,Fe-hydrogenase I large subunit
MFRIRDLEDEIIILKKELETERAEKADLELFKTQKLQELKQATESTYQATKAKFLEEIEILKKEKRELQSLLDGKDKDDFASRTRTVSKTSDDENRSLREKIKGNKSHYSS